MDGTPSRGATPPHRRGANLRIGTAAESKHHLRPQHHKAGRAKPISHATRIEPTNLSYKDLLRKHEFTPSGDSSSRSPLKDAFHSLSAAPMPPSLKQHKPTPSPLELSISEFRRRPIVEEPKKNVSGYNLFAKWRRSQNREKTASKVIAAEWGKMGESEKNKWLQQSECSKKEYLRKKQQWMDYVEEARRLGISVPTKSNKPLIQPIRIKNLLHLIPDICKFPKETQFVISKATEMFTRFYASKAIEVSERRQKHKDCATTTINARDCFYALQSDDKLNFLRALVIESPVTADSKASTAPNDRPNRTPSPRRKRKRRAKIKEGDGARIGEEGAAQKSSPNHSAEAPWDEEGVPQQKRRRVSWTEESENVSTSTSTSTSTPSQPEVLALRDFPVITAGDGSYGNHCDGFLSTPNPGYLRRGGYPAATLPLAAPSALPLPLQIPGVPPFPQIHGLSGHYSPNPFDFNVYRQRTPSSPKSQMVNVDEMLQSAE